MRSLSYLLILIISFLPTVSLTQDLAEPYVYSNDTNSVHHYNSVEKKPVLYAYSLFCTTRAKSHTDDALMNIMKNGLGECTQIYDSTDFIVISFIIEIDGSVSTIQVRSEDQQLNNITKRSISTGITTLEWQPGQINNNEVRTLYVIGMKVRLE